MFLAHTCELYLIEGGEEMERRPITIEGRKVDPPPAGANPRQVYDFFLLGLALCPQVDSEIAAHCFSVAQFRHRPSR